MSEVAWYDWLVFGCVVCLVVWGGFQLLMAVVNEQVELGGYSFRGGSEVDRVWLGTLCESPASGGLRLLCVLCRKNGLPIVQPVAVFGLPAPWAPLQGKWPVALPPPLFLRETRSTPPSAAVLARCLRQRQADALRADPRTVRTGGLNRG